MNTVAFGNRLWNGPTNILCSNSVVGNTMCSTGASSSFSSAMHSSVGAIGAWTHRPPLRSLITVMRTLTETFSPRPIPCFCSKNQTRPGSTSYLCMVVMFGWLALRYLWLAFVFG